MDLGSHQSNEYTLVMFSNRNTTQHTSFVAQPIYHWLITHRLAGGLQHGIGYGANGGGGLRGEASAQQSMGSNISTISKSLVSEENSRNEEGSPARQMSDSQQILIQIIVFVKLFVRFQLLSYGQST